jgi:hypothetical protein
MTDEFREWYKARMPDLGEHGGIPLNLFQGIVGFGTCMQYSSDAWDFQQKKIDQYHQILVMLKREIYWTNDDRGNSIGYFSSSAWDEIVKRVKAIEPNR